MGIYSEEFSVNLEMALSSSSFNDTIGGGQLNSSQATGSPNLSSPLITLLTLNSFYYPFSFSSSFSLSLYGTLIFNFPSVNRPGQYATSDSNSPPSPQTFNL